MNSQIQSLAFDARIAQLLQASELPTEDLPDNSSVTLFACIRDGALVGVVGLELYDSSALLRSLAVASKCRGEGIGNTLVQRAEHVAATSGVKNLYLLTTTAEQYFKGRGYSAASRATAPAAIAATRQFAGLCPSSSAFMVKRVG